MSVSVSVIIPAYNTAPYINKAITSSLNQTLTEIEIIVVDDGSVDNTLEVVKGFSDTRLKVLVNERNLGVSASRNRALAVAQGKWVALLDSDDWYAPNRLEKLVAIAEKNNADMVADNLNLIQNNEMKPWSTLLKESGGNIDEPKQIDPTYFVETGLYGQQGLHLGLVKPLFRREFLIQHAIQYDESMQVVEDFHLALNCLIRGAKFFFVPTPYYFYSSRPGSLVTQSKVRHINQFSDAINFFLQQDIVKQKPDLVLSLLKSSTILRQNSAYYKVIEPLKQRRFLETMVAVVQNPCFVIHLMQQLRFILNRRVRYYLLGDKTVFEPTSQITVGANSSYPIAGLQETKCLKNEN